MRIGDVVQHFKRETQKDGNKYLYVITNFAEDTETGEMLVIYRALYYPYKTYARRYDMFAGLVDKEKYPDVKQKYRFELWQEGR
jgi:hypothetical protein